MCIFRAILLSCSLISCLLELVTCDCNFGKFVKSGKRRLKYAGHWTGQLNGTNSSACLGWRTIVTLFGLWPLNGITVCHSLLGPDRTLSPPVTVNDRDDFFSLLLERLSCGYFGDKFIGWHCIANSQDHHPGAINPCTSYVSVFIKQQFVLETSRQQISWFLVLGYYWYRKVVKLF